MAAVGTSQLTARPTVALVIPPQFHKVLDKKPAAMKAAVLECINRLVADDKHPGLRVKRVKGRVGVWEARVDRGNRITFMRDGGDIILLNNCNHSILEQRRLQA